MRIGKPGRDDIGWTVGVTGFAAGDAGIERPSRGVRAPLADLAPPGRAGRRSGAEGDMIGTGLGVAIVGTEPELGCFPIVRVVSGG